MQPLLLNGLLNPSAWINRSLPRKQHPWLKDSHSSCAATIVRILYEGTVFSSTKEQCQQKLHRRRGHSDVPVLLLAGVVLCRRNDSVYLPTQKWLFIPFPSKDFKELHNWTSENFNICIRPVQLLITFFFIMSHWHHKIKTWKGKTQQPLCWFSHSGYNTIRWTWH